MKKDKAIEVRNDLEIKKILYNDFNKEVAIGDYILDDDASEIYRIIDM